MQGAGRPDSCLSPVVASFVRGILEPHERFILCCLATHFAWALRCRGSATRYSVFILVSSFPEKMNFECR